MGKLGIEFNQYFCAADCSQIVLVFQVKVKNRGEYGILTKEGFPENKEDN